MSGSNHTVGATTATALQARNAVALSFVLNGLAFATLVSRIPDLRRELGLDNGALGLLLLAVAGGSIVAMAGTGRLIEWWGAGSVVRLGAGADVVGLLLAGFGAGVAGSVPVTAVGLAVHGVGIGVWDVSMNVEAAEVERRLRRTVMPRFHAGWSLGSILGAGLGVGLLTVDTPMLWHLGLVAVVALPLAVVSSLRFVVLRSPAEPGSAPRAASAWTERRTLALGVMVLAFAVVEGSANDWLSLALIDGYGVEQWQGVAGFALFVCAMTTGRLLGPLALDRFGRLPVLYAACVLAAFGVLLTVWGGQLVLVAVGIVVWGLGASLGFPVGMSAAADEPGRAAARVSVVSTIGYGAFLSGPPLLGYLGDRVGTLQALLVVAVLMAPAAFTVRVARRGGVPAVPT